MEQLSKQRMDQAIADVMTNSVDDIRSLLNINGVTDVTGFNDKEVQIAFLKALKDSASFRNDFADYLAGKIQNKSNFVSQPGFDFVSQPMLNASGVVNSFDFGEAATNTSTSSAATTTQKSSFWDTLGGLASKENLQSVLNTGLGAVSTSLQSKAQKQSEERALELERLRLQQIQAQTELQKSGGGTKPGMSTGLIVGIIGGVVAITVLIVVLTRKKK